MGAVRMEISVGCSKDESSNWRMPHRRPIALLIIATLAVGCAAPQNRGSSYANQSVGQDATTLPALTVSQKDHDPCNEANKRAEAFANAIAGGLVGAAVGALIGALVGKATKSDTKQSAKRGALVGLGAGAIVGYNNGVDSYRRQCDLHKVAQRRNASAAFATLSTGKETTGEVVITPDQGHFLPNSDQLTDTGRTYFADIARQYTSQVQLASYQQTVRSTSDKKPDLGELKTYEVSPEQRAKLEAGWNAYRIVITGHTDDQQDATLAQDLSERRARNVANIFRERGVPETSMFYQGAGASFPIADNRTAVGRQKNNRVEAVVLYDEKTLLTYVDSRTPNYEYFSERPAEYAVLPSASSTPVIGKAQQAPKKVPAKVVNPAPPQPKSGSAPSAQAAKPAPSTVASKPSSPSLPPTPVEPGIDLGGVPIAAYSSNLSSRLGKVKPPSDGLMIDTFTTLLGVGTAYAASSNVIETCNSDDPRRHNPGQIKKLSDGSALTKTRAPISISDSYLFNTVRTVFYAPAGDHFVEVKNVTAKKNGELAEDMQFSLYMNYQTKSDEEKRRSRTADYSITPTAYSLLGEGGLLIRQFFPRGHGLVCMDMLVPNSQGVKKLPDTALVYNQTGIRKVANLTMER